jgi:Na+-translocating ferredoxin:NAD+ oxidoreductase RnfG subunit
MIWYPSPLCIASSMAMGATLICAPLQAQAKIYVAVEHAQQLLFPSKTFTLTPLVISQDYQEQMRKASSVRQPFLGNRIWRTNDGGWFIVDQVVGKHEMITYALGIKADGSVQGIEIMEYVESYGYEVAEMGWRKQFEGKKATDPLKLNSDIQNISGATLSCKHLVDGVKRLLVLHALALKNYSTK